MQKEEGQVRQRGIYWVKFMKLISESGSQLGNRVEIKRRGPKLGNQVRL